MLAAAPPDDLTAAVTGRLRDDLREGNASVGASERRWSTLPGAHLLKCAIALGDNEIDARAAVLRSPQGLRFDDGTGAGRTYLHANLYALEGAWWLAQRGDPEAARWCDEGARWLAWAQDPGGGGSARGTTGRDADGPIRADATAQAVRLWCGGGPRALRREHHPWEELSRRRCSTRGAVCATSRGART